MSEIHAKAIPLSIGRLVEGETLISKRRDPKVYPHLQVVLLSLLLISLGFVSSCTGTMQATPTPQESNTPASWAEQLRVAQQEAGIIDRDAVLEWVYTGELDPMQMNEPLLAQFVFVRSNGSRIRVELADSHPPKVVEVVPYFDTVQAPTSEEIQRYWSVLATIKLGPREIYAKTQDEGRNFSTGPTITLFLNTDRSETLGIPVAWGVDYYEESVGHILSLRVNPQTGEIMKRENIDLKPTPTP